jgi:hypothetical protein
VNLTGVVAEALDRAPTGRSVLLPAPNPSTRPIEVSAIWTVGQQTARWDNLFAAVIEEPRAGDDSAAVWAERAGAWGLQLLVLRDGEGVRVIRHGEGTAGGERRFPSVGAAVPSLQNARDQLFSAESLWRSRGMLPMDLDFELGATVSSFVGRGRATLGECLLTAINEAAAELGISVDVHTRGSNRPRSEARRGERRQIGHIVRVAVAYMGARILEDKGFWPERHKPTNDVVTLLDDVTGRTNGFFKTTHDESLALLRNHHHALRKIAKHLGGNCSFTLVDEQDVGELYEEACRRLPDDVATDDQFRDLQQHYTPVAIARRMLELLPLERIPVEERLIFDPAAGSGSLLLAATRRLALMRDAPQAFDERRAWLESHVAGNDLDPRARMITGLRYTLVQQALGDMFPSNAPRTFTGRDYDTLTSAELTEHCGRRPRVLVANPPYGERRDTTTKRDVQVAARFVDRALTWLREGDQFGIVLPQSFLTQTTHAVGEARAALARRADVFESWQFPEGVVGTSARQTVCVLLGVIGRSRYSGTIARKVQTENGKRQVAQMGYLGAACTARIEGGANWSEAVDPPARASQLCSATVGDLYHAFCGPTPKAGADPVEQAPAGQRVPNFEPTWQAPTSVTTDPAKVVKSQRYWRKEDLLYDARRNATEFSRTKLIASNDANRSMRTGLVVFLDRHGFWPDNHTHCIVVRRGADTQRAPTGWNELSEEDQLLWLQAILRSDTGRDRIEPSRTARHTNIKGLLAIPLPARAARSIVKLMHAWEAAPQDHEAFLARINAEVQRSYGAAPSKLTRSGPDPSMEVWRAEQRRPSRLVRGHIAEVSDAGKVRLHVPALEGGAVGGLIDPPQSLPGWALAGLWFEALLPDDVRTLDALAARPWALHDFRHPTLEELGALATVVLPPTHDPAPPPEALLRDIRSLRAASSERALTSAERERLDGLLDALDDYEEGAPRAIEERTREAARLAELKRLLAGGAR